MSSSQCVSIYLKIVYFEKNYDKFKQLVFNVNSCYLKVSLKISLNKKVSIVLFLHILFL